MGTNSHRCITCKQHHVSTNCISISSFPQPTIMPRARADSLNTEDLEAEVANAKRKLKCEHKGSRYACQSAQSYLLVRQRDKDHGTSRSSPAQISSSPKSLKLIPKPKGEPGTSQGYTFKDAARVPKARFNLWKVRAHILIYGNAM